MIYSIQVEGKFLEIEVYINEYKLYHQAKNIHNFSTLLTPWLCSGTNALRVRVVEDFFDEDQSPADEGNETVTESSLKVRVLLLEEKEVELVSFSWPEAAALAPERVGVGNLELYPFDSATTQSQSLQFKLSKEFELPEKPWEKSDYIVSSPDELFLLYESIYNAFAVKDLNRLLELSRHKIEFGAHVYGITLEEFRQECIEDLKDFLSLARPLKKYNFPKEELSAHVFLEGKVFRITNLFGNTPLETIADENGFQTGYDLICGVKGNNLVWLL